VKALVYHKDLNLCGGGEKVCLTTIEVLKELGFRVTLVTNELIDWNRIRKLHNTYVKIDKVVYIREKFECFTVYRRMVNLARLNRYRLNYDLIINTHGDPLPLLVDINYIHFPTYYFTYENLLKVSSLFKKIYYAPMTAYFKLTNYYELARVLLANSSFTREVIRRFIGLDALVLHPPVEVTNFICYNDVRDDIVVSCGRIHWEKNYDFILNVAKVCKDIKFVIIGSLKGEECKVYYNHLLERIRKEDIKNVVIYPNYPRSKQIELYRKAKVYLHAMPHEHFGIAIVEAMASGLIPVVHASGGMYFDIIEKGKYGFAYTTLDECVECIYKALDNADKMRDKVIRKSLEFSKERFKLKMRKVIECLL